MADTPSRQRADADPGAVPGAGDAPVPVEALDHVAIAVPDLDAAIAHYSSAFGATVSAPQAVPKQGIRIAYVELANTHIELMEPSRADSPIARYLERNPRGGIHHICMTTRDVDAAGEAAAAAGMRLLAPPATGHHGRRLFFLHPGDTMGSLIEIEAPEAAPDTE